MTLSALFPTEELAEAEDGDSYKCQCQKALHGHASATGLSAKGCIDLCLLLAHCLPFASHSHVHQPQGNGNDEHHLPKAREEEVKVGPIVGPLIVGPGPSKHKTAGNEVMHKGDDLKPQEGHFVGNLQHHLPHGQVDAKDRHEYQQPPLRQAGKPIHGEVVAQPP